MAIKTKKKQIVSPYDTLAVDNKSSDYEKYLQSGTTKSIGGTGGFGASDQSTLTPVATSTVKPAVGKTGAYETFYQPETTPALTPTPTQTPTPTHSVGKTGAYESFYLPETTPALTPTPTQTPTPTHSVGKTGAYETFYQASTPTNGVKLPGESGSAVTPTTPTTTPTTTAPETIDSYEQFLINSGATLEEIRDGTIKYYDDQAKETIAALGAQRESGYEYATSTKENAYVSAEQTRAEAHEQADITRERNIVDANSAYEQNKAGYGAKAEMLGRMGLTGSGYSEYLDAQAYAQQRAETQSAKALSESVKREASEREAAEKQQADSDYAKYIYEVDSAYNTGVTEANGIAAAGKLEAENAYKQGILENDKALAEYQNTKADEEEQENAYKREIYASLLSGANTGAYTADQVLNLAQEYELSFDLTQSLVSAANDYDAKQKANTNANVAADTGDTISTIQSMIKSGTLDLEDGQARAYKFFRDEVLDETADTKEIDMAYNDGLLSADQYKELREEWNETTYKGADLFFTGAGAQMNKSSAVQVLDTLINNSWCSDATKAALNAVYEALYTPTTNGLWWNYDASFLFFGSNKVGEKGNNIELVRDGKIYEVQYGGEVTDESVKEIASDIYNQQVFGYDEKIYIKMNGKIYLIEERDNSYPEKYAEVYRLLIGDQNKNSVGYANEQGKTAKANMTSGS